MLHLATDADTGRIVASTLTGRAAGEGSQVGPLLDRIDGSVASFTGDGAYDRDDVYVPSEAAQSAPTQRDAHLRCIAERGRLGWQRASGYNWRALVGADVARRKRVIGDGLRFRTDGRQATEMAVATNVLNRTLDLGRPEYFRLT